MKGLIHDLLRERGLTLTSLAVLAGVSRCHLSSVFKNHPGRGFVVRRKVARHLTARELMALGWDSNGRLKDPGNNVAGGMGMMLGSNVSRGTMLDMEQTKDPRPIGRGNHKHQ